MTLCQFHAGVVVVVVVVFVFVVVVVIVHDVFKVVICLVQVSVIKIFQQKKIDNLFQLMIKYQVKIYHVKQCSQNNICLKDKSYFKFDF